MRGPDDADLAAGFAAGDEAAVRAVYSRYAGPILTVAMGTLGKRDLADEVVQTTMLQAWRAAASFDPSRDLAPWLYAIARRVSIDIYRREARAATPAEPTDDRAAAVAAVVRAHVGGLGGAIRPRPPSTRRAGGRSGSPTSSA